MRRVGRNGLVILGHTVFKNVTCPCIKQGQLICVNAGVRL